MQAFRTMFKCKIHSLIDSSYFYIFSHLLVIITNFLMKSWKFWNSRQNSCHDKKTSAVWKSKKSFCTLENCQKFQRRLAEDFWNAAPWGFSWKIRPQCGKATTLLIHCAQPKKVRSNKNGFFTTRHNFTKVF